MINLLQNWPIHKRCKSNKEIWGPYTFVYIPVFLIRATLPELNWLPSGLRARQRRYLEVNFGFSPQGRHVIDGGEIGVNEAHAYTPNSNPIGSEETTTVNFTTFGDITALHVECVPCLILTKFLGFLDCSFTVWTVCFQFVRIRWRRSEDRGVCSWQVRFPPNFQRISWQNYTSDTKKLRKCKMVGPRLSPWRYGGLGIHTPREGGAKKVYILFFVFFWFFLFFLLLARHAFERWSFWTWYRR